MKPIHSDLIHIQAKSESEIEHAALNDLDAIPMTDAELAHARFMRLEDFLPSTKEQISLRLDREVLTWFRAHGRGYQTKINAALRAYIDTQNHDHL